MAKKRTYKKGTAKKVDPYVAIAEEFATLIESKETLPWQKPHSGARPRNLEAKPGTGYNGFNLLYMMMLDEADPYYVTYAQAKRLGGNVKKGAKAKKVCFFKTLEFDRITGKLVPDLPMGYTPEQKRIRDAKIDHSKDIPFLRLNTVFNASLDCEGLEQKIPKEEPRPERTPEERHKELAVAIERMKTEICPMVEVEHQPCYYPSQDKVAMPAPSKFKTIGDTHHVDRYAGVVFHEYIHATGHPTRLGRRGVIKSSMAKDDAYAYEELVAEFGSYLAMSEMGFANDDIKENSAAYIQNWARKIRNEPRAFVSASFQAATASRYMMEIALDKDKDKRLKVKGKPALMRELEEVPVEEITGIVPEGEREAPGEPSATVPEPATPVFYVQAQLQKEGDYELVSHSDSHVISQEASIDMPNDIVNLEIPDDDKWHEVGFKEQGNRFFIKSTEQGVVTLPLSEAGEVGQIASFRPSEDQKSIELWEHDAIKSCMVKSEIGPLSRDFKALPSSVDFEKPPKHLELELHLNEGWKPTVSVDTAGQRDAEYGNRMAITTPIPQDEMWHDVPLGESTACFARCTAGSIEIVTADPLAETLEFDPFSRELLTCDNTRDSKAVPVPVDRIEKLEHYNRKDYSLFTREQDSVPEPKAPAPRPEPTLCVFKPLSEADKVIRDQDFERAVAEIHEEVLTEVEVTEKTEVTVCGDSY